MLRPSSGKMGRAALIVLAGAGALAATARSPVGLDLALGGGAGGHALLRLGFASISVAFDSGQKCPDANNCLRVPA